MNNCTIQRKPVKTDQIDPLKPLQNDPLKWVAKNGCLEGA